MRPTTTPMRESDPLRLDRTLRGYAKRYVDFRLALRTGPAQEHVFELLPRELSDEGLEELAESQAGDPLRSAALPIAVWLRIEHDLIEARREEAVRLRHTRFEIDQPVRGSFSLAELRRSMLADPLRRSGFLSALLGRAERLGEARVRRWELEGELYARHSTPAARLGSASERAVSESLLKGTDAAYAELGLQRFDAYLERALGRDVSAQFPRRLSLRTLADYFTDSPLLRGLPLEAYAAPEMLGSASFVLGMAGFGERFFEAATHNEHAFVMRFDLRAASRAEWAALFALLPASRPFASRYLDVPRSRYGEYSLRLGQTWVALLRGLTLRAALVEPSLAGERSYLAAFRDLVPRALGFELDRRAAGALFVDDMAVTRLSGLALAAARARELTEAYDEDWFRNPRAIDQIREELRLCEPATPSSEQLELGVRELLRWLHEQLG
ncbi:MAG TPA: hypothetical protein VFQ61_08805 [Polyangiaceae bacterium]|nr:hypothetical protein [Polyangiaceae bacterium]